MAANAAAMLAAGIVIGRKKQQYYYFALALLTVNIILTFTDQFGFLDLVTLLIDLALILFLLIAKKDFIGSTHSLE